MVGGDEEGLLNGLNKRCTRGGGRGSQLYCISDEEEDHFLPNSFL